MKTKESVSTTVVCYGEVLWDVFPTQVKPGGAPMNVAYHLCKFGIDSKMISRVGDDEAGRKLRSLLDEWHISSANCGIDAHYPTGKVEAILKPDNEVSYVIHSDVAWDHIVATEADEALVNGSEAFVFGSLVTRDPVSRTTLYRLLDHASYKVFDVNLRPPYYDREVISYLLGRCDLLKLNQAELKMIGAWYDRIDVAENVIVALLQQKFGISEVIVTKGSEGAAYYDGRQVYFFPAFEVEVKDTVGSGDSFLAAFLALKIQAHPIDQSMLYATALGAFVASQSGACPNYTLSDLTTFITTQKEKISINQ